jgi:hypothetical protein
VTLRGKLVARLTDLASTPPKGNNSVNNFSVMLRLS